VVSWFPKCDVLVSQFAIQMGSLLPLQLGLGEAESDRASLLRVLANLPEHPESVPINALVPVKGTPMENLTSPSARSFSSECLLIVYPVLLRHSPPPPPPSPPPPPAPPTPPPPPPPPPPPLVTACLFFFSYADDETTFKDQPSEHPHVDHTFLLSLRGI
jgi:hypothetical protein